MSPPSSHLGGFRVLGMQVSQASWPSSAGAERAAAVRGLNGRGWRGGPGPRLSAEHPLGRLCQGLGYLRELEE